MTDREKAIKIFNTVLLFGKCDCPKEEIEECLRMAIKALEQEPEHRNYEPKIKQTDFCDDYDLIYCEGKDCSECSYFRK